MVANDPLLRDDVTVLDMTRNQLKERLKHLQDIANVTSERWRR